MSNNGDFEIVVNDKNEVISPDYKDRAVGAAIDNFPRILDIAAEIVQIEKLRIQADAYKAIAQEKRLYIEQEAEAYVRKLNAETDSVIGKAEVIRSMMRDYYNSGHSKLSGEEFSKIISEVLDRMWGK